MCADFHRDAAWDGGTSQILPIVAFRSVETCPQLFHCRKPQTTNFPRSNKKRPEFPILPLFRHPGLRLLNVAIVFFSLECDEISCFEVGGFTCFHNSIEFPQTTENP